MYRINYPLVNKVCDAKSHFVHISYDFAVIRSLILLDHLDLLGLKLFLMGSEVGSKEKRGPELQGRGTQRRGGGEGREGGEEEVLSSRA